MKNKKGQNALGIIFFIGLLAIILIIGFIMAIGSSVTNYVADEVVPELSGLGVVGNTNLTEVSQYTIQPANVVIQSLTWLTGVFYVIMLLGSLGIAFSMRGSGANGWLIGLYFMLVILLIFLSIFISNMYQDFYETSGDFGNIMREHGLLSYMILYAPMIYAVIGFITGAIIFSGKQEESYV